MGYYKDNCVFELKPEQSDWGDFLARPSAYFRGNKDMPGATYHVGFQSFVKMQRNDPPFRGIVSNTRPEPDRRSRRKGV